MSPSLGFSVEGPSQAKIECDDKGDGSCDVRYWPTEAGEYAVHVLCNNEDIQHSPFMAEIVNPPGRDFYPDKVLTHSFTLSISVYALYLSNVCTNGLVQQETDMLQYLWESNMFRKY